MNTKMWSENVKGGNYAEDVLVNGKIILEWILTRTVSEGWTGVIWLK
jgi:hypothetical protein